MTLSASAIIRANPEMPPARLSEITGLPVKSVIEIRSHSKKRDYYNSLARHRAYRRKLVPGWMPRPPAWTDDQEATLRRLWGKKSAANIGTLIGKTKNAVIGRARDRNLPRLA